MYSRISILFLASLTLPAQALRDVAPLKYWPAPLYWQPTHAETSATTRSELFNVTKDHPSAQTPAQTPANALVFVAMTPCRLVDTRVGFGFTGAFGPPSLVGGATRAFPLQTSTTCSIPTTAQAYSLNITIVPPGQMFYLTIWPLGSSQPNVSTQNDLLGTVIANAAIVPAGNDAGSGSVNVFVSNNTDLIIDINGYYAPQSGITLAQGTAAAPSMSFAGDAGTGVYSSGAGMLNASAAGIQALAIGDIDQDTALGVGALAVNAGHHNTAVGYAAMGVNTTGIDSTAVGNTALGSNTTGSYNSSVGGFALADNTTGSSNTAVGHHALLSNTTANNNTAVGDVALSSTTTGSNNTAVGQSALLNNDTGAGNTAAGQNALQANVTGANNTAVGWNALQLSTTNSNTAVGSFALANTTTGGNNTATGTNALRNDTTGFGNTADGISALSANTTGAQNEASGNSALFMNTTGSHSTAVGFNALYNNTTGGNNIALGYTAALNVSAGNSNNVHIGSLGASADSGTIRIGDAGTYTSFFAAGVRGTTTANNNAVPVVIDSNGQLGTVSSSIRFKEDVHDMADASNGLLQLRPVTYRYKQPYADGSKPVDYGLIAEEVAQVYPDLVVKNADGQVETVQYQKLTPMLLNELQKQHREIELQKAQANRQAADQRQQIERQQEMIRSLATRLEAIEALHPDPSAK